MKRFALLLSLLCATSVYADALPNAPHIITTGNYEISTAPDILELSVQIIDTNHDAQKARNVVEERSSTLITVAKGLGIENKDINSAQLQVTPRYNWNNNQQVYTGTEVARTIQITLRDLNKYNDLLQAVLASKVVRINSSELLSSKQDALEAEAQQRAVANAKDQALRLTEGLSQSVGDIYSISTMGGYSGSAPLMYRVANMEQDKSAFEPGSITINSSVQVVFYLIKK